MNLVAFIWHASKASANYRKHGVLFSTEAVGVFADGLAITVTDDESDPAEQRFVTLGMGTKGRLIVVAYTYRDDDFGSYRHVPRSHTNAKHTRSNYERELRFH